MVMFETLRMFPAERYGWSAVIDARSVRVGLIAVVAMFGKTARCVGRACTVSAALVTQRGSGRRKQPAEGHKR